MNATSEGFLFFNHTINEGEIIRIQLSILPIAIFNHEPLNPTIDQTVFFNSTSYDTDDFIVNWTWTIDNTIMKYSEKIEHIFLEKGNFQINLKVIDNESNFDTSNIMIHIGPFEYLDINQSTHNRGFPIRHSLDGDWAGAQNFTPTLNMLTYCEITLRKFGTPEFNLTVELREGHPQGTLLDTLTFIPDNILSSWFELELEFEDIAVEPNTNLFIVIPPAPSGLTTSFGYEWGYAFGNQYNDGAFWFTRDGGGLWRDLPTMYDFVFRTYGYS